MVWIQDQMKGSPLSRGYIDSSSPLTRFIAIGMDIKF